ncbi:MAG: PQQ-dependent sugar dehydrogenase [SAR324 cluster bacterium]|nr:PQQ-dependent sugar dehydrogenase [SAR324 cluster bacterium]
MKRKAYRNFLCPFVFFAILLLPFHLWAQGAKDWVALVKDHAIEVESTGWHFPVDIAFVPEPGTNPKDPLYYVTELRGTLKVVTNDRTVLTYAEKINTFQPATELPSTTAEMGLTGVCLDPENGYLFATSVYEKAGTFYNKIVRFEHETKAFAVKPKRSIEFRKIFENDETASAHQIGKCEIGKDGKLYVGVGDGHVIHLAQRLDNPNGKILRLNLDGSAPRNNPFYNPLAPDSVISYIYAYGFRNPFAIALDDRDSLYFTDNGPNRDRLGEIVPGKNYLWDGTNESMRGNSGIWNWSDSVAPADMIYLGESTNFQYWKERLLVAQGGTTTEAGPSKKGKITINSFKVKLGFGLQDRPETLVAYKGSYQQLMILVAEGPDGIYFSGFFPDFEGNTYIYKLIRKEGVVPDTDVLSGVELFAKKECTGCHRIHGEGGAAGPALDGLMDRLPQRLASSEYEKQLEELEESQNPIHVKYREIRETISQMKGEERAISWLRLHLEEPKFDTIQSSMSNPKLSEEENKQLVAYLLTLRSMQDPRLSTMENWHRRFKVWWDTDYNARPTVFFIVGIFCVLLFQSLSRKIRRRFDYKRKLQ